MRARLIVEAGVVVPQSLDLPIDQTVRLGRNNQNDIVVDDPHASRWHAELRYDGSNWLLVNCSKTNGTKVNGVRIQEATPLESNYVICIGDARLRFALDSSTEGTAELPIFRETRANEKDVSVNGTTNNDFHQTILHPDELTALLQFMTASLTETTPHGLVNLALATILRQTLADVAGFLGIDEEDPHFRLVLPARAEVDTKLSRKLTERVEREKMAVWLGAALLREMDSESLVGYSDAIGVPLRVGRAVGDDRESEALGTLHIYRSHRLFSEREVRFCEVLAGCLTNALNALRTRRALEADNLRLRDHATGPSDILIGDSPAMKLLRQQIAQFARLPCTVLITGESGVGKELVALGLHQQSPRGKGPLVTLNCGAIPASLAESELFGHEKGAFSGAERDRMGCFLRADQGTMFLDEIGEMPMPEQTKLLRVLESKIVRPVGGDEEIKVDVRILAATNRDLKRELQENRFRRDLYFRLGTTIHVPPLREHLEDVPALATHFLGRLNAEYRRQTALSSSALDRLQSYPWPGNVRQLRTVLETTVATTDSSIISARALERLLLDEPSSTVSEHLPTLNLDDLEVRAIRQALGQTGGNNTQAARVLGIHRDTLLTKMKKYGIDRKG